MLELELALTKQMLAESKQEHERDRSERERERSLMYDLLARALDRK